jgi:hypothetical protein
MDIDCRNVKQFFIKHGLNLAAHQGKVKQYSVEGKTTRCSTCSIFKSGRPITVSVNGAAAVSMQTCETNYDALICLVSGIMIAFFISVIVIVLVRHGKHMKHMK